MKNLLHLKSHKSKLDYMEKNIDEVIKHIKHEISVSSKRDTQLIDSKVGSQVMLSITDELSCATKSNGVKAERDSIFVKTEGDRKLYLTSDPNAG